MRLLRAFFTLIRWKNILIVALAQLLLWCCVIWPIQTSNSENLFLKPFPFFLLMLSTIMLAAAGYIINDYFDIRIDLRNRPDKVIIGKIIKQRWAMFWHSLFNVLGIGIAYYLAREIGNPYLVVLQVVTTVLLWWYSTHLKRMFISGNICVALLTAMSLATVIVYEPSMYSYFLQDVLTKQVNIYTINPVFFVSIYIYFAFFLTWLREIVKDMEDFKGDAEEGCITMPIKLGIKTTNKWIYAIGLATAIPIIVSVFVIAKMGYRVQDINFYVFALYILSFILLPLILFLYKIGQQATAVHYEKMSKRLKWLMLLGIFTLPIYYLLY